MSRALRYVAALPVWGEFYCNFFLKAALPGLLQPGNLPAFATPATVTALVYTRPQDLPVLTGHPLMQQLARFCDVRFKALPEDIEEFSVAADGIRQKLSIMSRCLEVAIRAAEDDPDLVALFPLADLICADGTLGEIARRMADGVRAVGVVTPHVTCEAIQDMADSDFAAVIADPRRLLRFTLDHAHPSFRHQFIDSQPFSGRPSQFYVSAGAAGFVGHALHLHPFAVRPAVRVNRLRASIDTDYFFSAVPGAGDRSVIDSSDDALIVECSRRAYLADLPDWPAFSDERMAAWVKQLTLVPGQRELLATPVRFYLDGGPDSLRTAEAQSRAIADRLRRA
ncbi:MAG: hypothetical protein RIC36_09360 [Rhodospirillales bacterium]